MLRHYSSQNSTYLTNFESTSLWYFVAQCFFANKYIYDPPVNSRVPKTARHGIHLHRICPKLLIDLIPNRLKSQASIRWLTRKLFGSSPSRIESLAPVCGPSLKLFGSSTRRLSFNRRRNCWLTSQPSVPQPSQPLTTHVLDVCHPPVTETKLSPIVCTASN